jgi:hypothetical protein
VEPKDKTSEMHRLWNLSAGYYGIVEPAKMLFGCLTNTDPKEVHRLEFDGTIPPTFQEAAMLLYRVAADSEELKGLAAQRICGAIETFLSTAMSKDEVEDFKKQHPMKIPIEKYGSILGEMEAEGGRDPLRG